MWLVTFPKPGCRLQSTQWSTFAAACHHAARWTGSYGPEMCGKPHIRRVGR